MIGKSFHQYEIVEKIGMGGMGVVYKARDTKLDRVVALKFLPPHFAGRSSEQERFKVEARAAAALNHPNIATIHNIEEVDEHLFIVMELVEGRELSTVIEESEGGLSAEKVIDYALQIARGLQAAHHSGIIHRDIKGSNVLVNREGLVKIMDFGLARFMDGTRLTREGTTLGTIAYMSPEQVEGAEVDQQSDIWSFGVLLYEMLTGKLPFRGEYDQAVIYSILNEEPKGLGALRDQIPDVLASVIEKSLQKERENRYRSIDEVIGELESIGVAATGPVASAAGRDWTKKYGWYAAAMLLIILLFAGYQLFSVDLQRIDSIAVLPLANLSGDPEQEYFADGMTEALILSLGKISSLRVISRQSVMRYKDSEVPLGEIADDLNVEAVVEGSALQHGDRVRITAKLIDAEKDNQLWNRSYDRKMQDILSLHSEVAHAIAREIQIALSAEDRQRLQNTRNVDPEALDAYLKGRYYSRDWTMTESVALENFKKAIELDPDFALAYTGLAEYYLTGAHVGIPPHDAFPKAIEAAEKALNIDPGLAEAETILADSRYHYQWDWQATEVGFKRAIELNPGYSTAYWWYSGYLSTMKRFEDALVQIRKAQRLDPLALNMKSFEARIHFYAREYDQAIEASRRTLELNPKNLPSIYWLGRSYTETGKHAEAVKLLVDADKQFNGHPMLKSALAQAHAAAGKTEAADTILNGLSNRFENKYFPPHLLVMAYADLRDLESAFEWLKRAEEMRDATLIWLTVDPGYDNLRSASRFTELLERMGLRRHL
ncbi:MAG: protein kinase [Balneolaceae bacterium]|nr:protein kinase [Balneolaceae bacterium]